MKRRSFSISGGLFYAAPIGAGLSEVAFFAVIPFTGLFLLRTLVMGRRPLFRGTSGALPTLLVHAAVVSVLLSIGYMLGVVLGVRATLSLTGWLIVGLVALVLERLIRPQKNEAEAGELIEFALKKLNQFADEAEEVISNEPDLPLQHPTQAEAASLAQAYGEIDAIPADAAPEQALRQILRPLDAEVRPHILLNAFLNRAGRTDTRRDRHAVLLLASDGALTWRQPGEARMAETFDLIVDAADTVTLAHFLRLGDEMLDGYPTTRITYPPVERLLDISEQIESEQPELAEGLVGLANRLEEMEAEHSDD